MWHHFLIELLVLRGMSFINLDGGLTCSQCEWSRYHVHVVLTILDKHGDCELYVVLTFLKLWKRYGLWVDPNNFRI